MSQFVIMSKNNGVLAIATPLFKIDHEQVLEKLDGYQISLIENKPTAYVVEVSGILEMWDASLIETQCEFLGEL